MFEQFFKKQETIDRARASWIAAAVERYLSWLDDNGYSRRNGYRWTPVLIRFGEWAQEHGATRWSDLTKHIDAFVDYWSKQHGRHSPARYGKLVATETRGAITQMLRLAVPGFQATQPRPPEPFAEPVPGFFSSLREERGVRETTLIGYRRHLRRFETYLAEIGLRELHAISPVIVSAFITRWAPTMRRTGIRELCGILRVFLRYLYREQFISTPLARGVEMPKSYCLSRLPRSITWEEVRRLLECIDRRTSLGRRDYAMILLLVSYGLRAFEVSGLTLDDIDWKRERLFVPQRKAGHSSAYPLSPIVGEAILAYLKQDRPKREERRLFFTAVAPIVPIPSRAISMRVTFYLRKIGITVHRPGSHTLRHTCVQRLVDANFSLKTIGDYVGHRSPASTQIYSKVAVEALREVALGNGEDVL